MASVFKGQTSEGAKGLSTGGVRGQSVGFVFYGSQKRPDDQKIRARGGTGDPDRVGGRTGDKKQAQIEDYFVILGEWVSRTGVGPEPWSSFFFKNSGSKNPPGRSKRNPHIMNIVWGGVRSPETEPNRRLICHSRAGAFGALERRPGRSCARPSPSWEASKWTQAGRRASFSTRYKKFGRSFQVEPSQTAIFVFYTSKNREQEASKWSRTRRRSSFSTR